MPAPSGLRSMLVALLADIHGNREAFAAVLAHARQAGAKRFVVLGDIVGYGADPGWCAEQVEALVANGAIALRGNHDQAITDDAEDMNPTAMAAIAWTRDVLKPSHRAFLQRLPLTHEEDDRLYVHASAYRPHEWAYVMEPRDADVSFMGTGQRVTIVGHVHVPALFNAAPGGRAERFRPVPGKPVPLLRQRRWLAVVGSVGQPRDGSAAAGYGLLDTAKALITFQRVPYDVDTAAAKIRAAGLPETLARRLFAGR